MRAPLDPENGLTDKVFVFISIKAEALIKFAVFPFSVVETELEFLFRREMT